MVRDAQIDFENVKPGVIYMNVAVAIKSVSNPFVEITTADYQLDFGSEVRHLLSFLVTPRQSVQGGLLSVDNGLRLEKLNQLPGLCGNHDMLRPADGVCHVHTVGSQLELRANAREDSADDRSRLGLLTAKNLCLNIAGKCVQPTKIS